MMDQQKLYMQKYSKTFYVHDGLMEIIHISIAKLLSMMYQHVNIVQQTFYVHVGKNILYRNKLGLSCAKLNTA